MRRLLADRNFQILALGQSLSAFGDYAMFLAFGIWAKQLTGSNAAAGLTFLPFAMTSLAGPWLGVFIDRFPRRYVMIATDLAAAAFLLPLLAVQGRDDVWLLYVVAFLLGLCVVVYQGARSGLMVSMLDEELLADANGFLQSSNQGMRLLAPLVGAALFAVIGGQAVVALDATTFAVSALLLVAVRSPDIQRRTDHVHVMAELREGLQHIRRTDVLIRLTIGTSIVSLFVGLSEVAIFAVIDGGLHRPPEFLGVFSSVQGVGAILAGLTAGWLMRRWGGLRTVALATFSAALGLVFVSTAMLFAVMAGAVGFGLASTLYMVGSITLMQTRTPLEFQGRVMTAFDAAVTVPYMLSFAMGALLVSILHFRTVFLIEAAGLVLAGLYVARGNVERRVVTVA